MEKFNEIISGSRLVLVDFFAQWCGPCKTMAPILVTLKKEMGDKIRIIKIDVDKHQALAQQYGVQAVPTFMIFRKGEMLHRFSGAMPRVDLIYLLEQYL